MVGEMKLESGDRVEAVCLVGAKHLNGRRGLVTKTHNYARTGRVAVAFLGPGDVPCSANLRTA